MVLKQKVKEEVRDLNALNREIDTEMATMKDINKINERKMFYSKEVKT